jgi:predicted outer membrane repeat protein
MLFSFILLLCFCVGADGLLVTVTSKSVSLPASAAACYYGSPTCGILDAKELCLAASLQTGQVCQISISPSVNNITLSQQLDFPQAPFSWVIQLLGGKNVISRNAGNPNLFRIIQNDGKLHLKNIAIKGGYLLHNINGGSGILNNGELKLEDSTLDNNYILKNGNSLSVPSNGGGIYNAAQGVLTILNVLFTKNWANGYCYSGCSGSPPNKGGAIYNAGVITGRNVSFTENIAANHDEAASGGAIYNEGSITLDNVLFKKNGVLDDLPWSASEKGGAVYQQSGSSVFKFVTFHENASGNNVHSGQGEAAGIYLRGGTMEINRGTFTGNDAIQKNSDNAYVEAGATLQFVNTFIPPLAVTGVVGAYTLSYPVEPPSGQPTSQPSGQPTRQPTAQPSCQPTGQPSTQPSPAPLRSPTVATSVEDNAHFSKPSIYIAFGCGILFTIMIIKGYQMCSSANKVQVAPSSVGLTSVNP